MSDAWYKNAVIYAVAVKSFRDSDGDGVGDFQGLIERLDHLSELGVTCLWLLPCYPTPNRDDGYDVADHYGIDPRLGSLGDFVVFVREARSRGMRVILDLVVNHTSDQHPWFQAARSDRSSPFRDYYVWTQEPPEVERRGYPVFPGEQAANWTYDAEAGAYYWHWFYDHQPDLNTGNPAVREEIRKIMGFWLELGVSGFRVDAATFLFRRKGVAGSYPEDPDGFLIELRRFLEERRPDAVLLAEADVPPEMLSFYLGEGDRMHLLFNFILNNHLFLALARESAEPLRRGMDALPLRPGACQWANFVRNHDELNLDKLTAAEREEVFEAFAPDPSMRIYGRGIRRRVPPMLGGDRRRLELVYSLLFALPGTPVLRYGEEIGMGDDLALAGRWSVRTPMQWSAEVNGGFSSAPAEALIRPVIASGDYGYARVNAEAQRVDPESLLHRMRRLIRARLECPEIGHGATALLETGAPHVLTLRSEWREGCVITVHNLSSRHVTVTVPLQQGDVAPMCTLEGVRAVVSARSESVEVKLGAYGFGWLRVAKEAAAPCRGGSV